MHKSLVCRTQAYICTTNTDTVLGSIIHIVEVGLINPKARQAKNFCFVYTDNNSEPTPWSPKEHLRSSYSSTDHITFLRLSN